jgi:hypothetical protein
MVYGTKSKKGRRNLLLGVEGKRFTTEAQRAQSDTEKR